MQLDIGGTTGYWWPCNEMAYPGERADSKPTAKILSITKQNYKFRSTISLNGLIATETMVTSLRKYVTVTCVLLIPTSLLIFITNRFYGDPFQERTFRFIERHRFSAESLSFRNGTLKLLGKYRYQASTKKSEIPDVLLEIDNVNRLLQELLSKQRSRNIKRKTSTLSFPTDYRNVSTHDFNATALYRRKNTSVYNGKNYDGDLVYPDMKYFVPNRRVEKVNCGKIFQGNENEISLARKQMDFPLIQKSAKEYINETKDCINYIENNGFIMSSLTDEELNFPLAYSILMYKDVRQFEILLRAIYRPQNYYCIHTDVKSQKDVYDAVSGIAACFDNVIMTSERFNISWGKYSILEPEFNCMKQLLQYKKWKYFINLTGQEYPLRTNAELVKILKGFNGANDVEGTVKRADPSRWTNAGAAPDGIIPVKGAVHITVNRGFVEYVVNSPVAERFKKWVKDVEFPDEVFFSSLNHNPQLQIPGSYKGNPESDDVIKPFLSRFKNWGIPPNKWTCGGKRVRMLCVFGINDLPLLSSRLEFFANKFYLDNEPLALMCMEELHFNRTRDEYISQLVYDTSIYSNLSFLKNVTIKRS